MAKKTLKRESVVIQVAERLYTLAQANPDQEELKVLAGRLETSNSHLLEDIYEQCCNYIDPFVIAGILPPSVVESVEMLVEDLAEKLKAAK